MSATIIITQSAQIHVCGTPRVVGLVIFFHQANFTLHIHTHTHIIYIYIYIYGTFKEALPIGTNVQYNQDVFKGHAIPVMMTREDTSQHYK